jgi:hypothetical protein
MKKTVLLILIGLCTFYSCKKGNEKEEQIDPKLNPTQVEIYSSANAKKYLYFDEEYSEYKIVAVDNPQKFATSEIGFVVKENDFDYNKSDDFDYYTIKSFELGETHFKVILYSAFGENDAKVANVQLNSYKGDVQVDALLLDCRFEFETEYYRDFVIKNDQTIAIRKIAVDKLLYSPNGDIIGKREVNDTLVDVVKYKIDPQGTFIKL